MNHDLNSFLLRKRLCFFFFFLWVQHAEPASAATSIKPRPNRLFSLSLCDWPINLKSKFASGKRTSGRNWDHLMSFGPSWQGDFAFHLTEHLCAHTVSSVHPSFSNDIFLSLTQILNPLHILNTVFGYGWYVFGVVISQIQKKENPLMNQPRTLSLLVLRHRIQYSHIKCETPTGGWTDTFHFFVSIPPFLDKDTLPQQRHCELHNSPKSTTITIQYLTNGYTHVWATISSLSLIKSQYRQPHKHTQLPFSPHTKKVLTFQPWKSQESSSATFGRWLENNQDIIAKYSSRVHALSHYKSCECYHTCSIKCLPVTMDSA